MPRRSRKTGKPGRPPWFKEPVKFQVTMEREQREAFKAFARARGQDASEIVRQLIATQMSPAKNARPPK